MFQELSSINEFTAFNTLLCYLISLFNNFPLTLTDLQCKNQGDCNDGNNIKCGVCINNDNSKKGTCKFIFPNQFKGSNKCEKLSACEDKCSNNGYCTMDAFASYAHVNPFMPTCYCNTGFYGSTCEHSNTQHYPIKTIFENEIAVEFIGVQNPFETIGRLIYLRRNEAERTPSFSVSIQLQTDFGFFDSGSYYLPIKNIKHWAFYLTTYSRLPYKPYDPEAKYKTLQYRNEVLGYISKLWLKIMVKGIVIYERKLGVFVSYKNTNLVCNPIVQLSGCSSSKEYTNVFLKFNHIKISSSVIYIEDGRYVNKSKRNTRCEDGAKYHWKIWDNINGRSQPHLEYSTVKSLLFYPYSLGFKHYKVLLEVTSMQDPPSANFAYCYFKIKFSPLVADIDGGSERTVAKQFGLTLSTTRSYDPNMPRDKQGHMHTSWSCVDVLNPGKEICKPSLTLPVSNNYTIPSEILSYGTTYNITLKVWTNLYDGCTECGYVGPVFDFAVIAVANKTDKLDERDYIYIQCILNCKQKVKHTEQLYLRVKTISETKVKGYHFSWSYYEEGQNKENDTSQLVVDGLPSFMFLVKENALSSGKSYVIVVRIANKPWFAKYAFRTEEVEFEGNCSITPDSGIKGLSLFEIVCQNFSGSPIYEFYDKTPKEAQEGVIFNGRMLGTSGPSSRGELKNFRVTRGQVLVYIIDNSGIFTQKHFIVDILPWNVTEEILHQIYFNVTEILNQGKSAKMLEYISAVPDIVPLDSDKKEILNKLLYFITLVPTDTLANIKLTTSTMANVLLNLNNPIQLAIEPELMRDTLYIVKNQTTKLSMIVSTGAELNGMAPQEIRLVVTFQLNCLHAALMGKDPKTIGITEFDYDLKTLDVLMDSSSFAEDSIYLITDILTFLQAPGQPPTKISASGNASILWVMENDEEYNLTNYLSQYQEIPVKVSNALLKEFSTDLRNNQEELVVRVATLDDNIFWWSMSDIRSNLLSVSLVKRSKNNKLGRIKFVKHSVSLHINLYFSLNSTQVKGHVMPYNDSKVECTLERDLSIHIHRFDPEPQSRISLKFLFPQTNGSLLVYVLKGYRPDCSLMKNAFIINEEHSTYHPIISKEEPTFYYIGIIPKGKVSVTYTFELDTIVCQYWAKGQWSSKGCKISDETNNLLAHCKCDHFSIFGAAFPVPPHEIDPFSDINLFLTVFENPLVVSFVSIILLIFLTSCFWAWRRDKIDKRLKNVIILEDSFPNDYFPYLLAVYTSSRFNAGTTAHVGIKITGSSTSSRPHMLSCKDRKVLKRNYDDWFVIYCPNPLGDLQSIHLWHDNSGSSPDWFCDKVIVYDLTENTEVVFVVEQWIALRLTYFPEAIITGASISQVKNVKRIFLDNCVLGLREGHTLLSIILRHPRSEISRLQRISVLMCCVMTAMLCSIMFYSPQVDDHEYIVGLREFYISVQSLVISLLTTGVVLFAFKKSYAYKYLKTRRSTIQFRASEYKEYEVNTTNDKSVYSNFVRFVSKTMKSTPFVPAQLDHTEPVIVIRKTWRIIAWTLCIGVIIVCSFFVMLYGLKLGLIKSKIWLSSVLFTLSEDFFVSTPARIIFFSILLSIAFQKMCEIDVHRVESKDILATRSQMNEAQIAKLLIKRRHQMYAPLQADFKNEMLRKKELWNNWWTVIEFILALCFIIVLSVVVFEFWSSHFFNNSRLKTILTKSKDYESFFDYRNIPQVNYFLEHSLLRSLYKTFWYNKKPIEEKDIAREYWAKDFTHTMVGYQRYRQIRVLPIKCKFTFINTTRKCIPHYNGATEDMGDYGSRWKPARWHDIKQSISSWKYTDISQSRYSTFYRLCSKSGVIFHDGGYLVDLGPTKRLAVASAHEIVLNNWQDQLTRALFVEFTMYNINMDLFSQVTIIVEYLLSGTIQLKAHVVSVESKMKVSFWNALFVAFVVYYVIRSGYLINRQGLFEYLSTSSRNRSQFVVVLLGTLSISVAMMQLYSSTVYYKHFINKGYGDTYFDFDSFVYYFIQLQNILSYLLAVAIFRTILIIRGGRMLLNYFYTLTISLQWIFWLTVVVCIFFFVQVHLVLLLNIFSFYNLEEIVINLKFTQYFKSQCSDLKYVQVFMYVKCVVVNVLLCLYFLIFVHYFRIAQTYKIKTSDKFNLILFVWNEIKITKRTNKTE